MANLMKQSSAPFHWLAAAAALASAAVASTGVAALHIWSTSQYGVICGSGGSETLHCWACYASPLLAIAALGAWRAHRTAPAKARARARR